MKLIIAREENDYEDYYFLKLIIPNNYLDHFTFKTKYVTTKSSFRFLLNLSEDQLDSCLVDLNCHMPFMDIPMFVSFKDVETFKDRLEAILILINLTE